MNKRIFILIIIDLMLILVAFYLSVLLKGVSFASYLESYQNALLLFALIWIATSIVFEKYVFTTHSARKISANIIKSNLLAFAVVTFLIYFTRSDRYSRFIVFNTILMVTLLELFIYNLWAGLKRIRVIPDNLLGMIERSVKRRTPPIQTTRAPNPMRVELIKRTLQAEFGNEVYEYLNTNTRLFDDKTLIVSTTTPFNIINQPDGYFDTLINLKRTNDIRRINKFFEAVNQKLPRGGTFVCMAETQEQRKKRILSKFPPGINWIYYFFDYVIKRVFPKFSLTKGIYFFLTRGENRVISRAELLGRLYSCGFYVNNETEIEKLQYVVAIKNRRPFFDEEPTYGPIIKLRRVGKNGKIIRVYKFRTMHPYSEYLQEYIFNLHNLEEGGKFRNDFRVSTIGAVMRRLWIDELPMIINLFRGELKIVGVRPLSEQYFNLYTPELQERRIKYKPGLVPPFYMDNPKTLEEIMASEVKYLDAYDKHPLFTDIRYLFGAAYNIIFKKYRSS